MCVPSSRPFFSPLVFTSRVAITILSSLTPSGVTGDRRAAPRWLKASACQPVWLNLSEEWGTVKTLSWSAPVAAHPRTLSRWLNLLLPVKFQGNQIKWVSTSTAPARLISPNSGNFCSANMIYGSSSVKMNPHKPQTTLAWCSGLWLRRVFPVRLDGAAHQQFGVASQMSAQTSVCSTGG